MASPPLITVIIPCYNQGQFLSEAIESVLAQSHRHVEIIVVDDGSTDGTETVASQYQGVVSYFRQENQGPSAARNRGLREAHGDFIQFLDADDLLEPEKLSCHAQLLCERPLVGIVYGDVRYFSTNQPHERLFGLWGESGPWIRHRWEESGSTLEKLVRGNIMCMPSPLLRKEVITSIGLFDESLRGAEDYDYWWRCAAAGIKFQFLEKENTLCLIRIHHSSASHDRPRMIDGTFQMRVKLAHTCQDRRLRHLNWWMGLSLISQDSFSVYAKQVIRLTLANFSWAVLVSALKVLKAAVFPKSSRC